jgi:molecular chaperone GrpE
MPSPFLTDESSATADVDQLQQELRNAVSQAEEHLAGWKQTQADFENFRKRKEAESAEWIAFGKQAGFVQLLPILDSLQQAIRHAPEIEDEKYKSFKEGLEGIAKQIDSAIEKMNIKKMQSIGEKFDPNLHEAVKEVLAKNGEEEGVIAEEYQTGYLFDGKVLRPAQVGITKKIAD